MSGGEAGAARVPGVVVACRWAAWGALVLLVLVRAAVAIVPMPYWDISPLQLPVPMAGIGPAGSLLLDVLTLVAACAALATAGGRAEAATVACVAAGAGVLALHAWTGPGLAVDQLHLGASWTAALVGGVALRALVRDERLRRLTAALLVGFVMVLVAKGAQQVVFEHPRLVGEFRASRDSVLAAHGWSPDSPAARAYERRLMQAEASGWFALSNVYASLVAAGALALAWFAAVGWGRSRGPDRSVPGGVLGLVVIGAGAALAGVWMAGSKAGAAVVVAGGALLAVAWWARRGEWSAGRARAAGVIAIAASLGALAAVGARGLAGDAIGERSVLFRAFYVEGAARIAADHPLIGVGPAGFQDAYMLAKRAEAPEDVSSPHSVAMDWVTAMGAAGVAWIGLLAWWTWSAGARAGAARESAASGSRARRLDAWAVIVVASATMVVSAWLDARPADADEGVARLLTVLGGLAAWAGVALAIVWVARTDAAWGVGVSVAAVMLVAHGQIEMAPTRPGSAAWVIAMLAIASAPTTIATRPTRCGAVAGGAVGAAAVALAIAGLAPAWRWEGALARAWRAVEPIGVARSRLIAIEQAAALGVRIDDSEEEVASDLARVVGSSPPQSREEFFVLLRRATGSALERATTALERAASIAPAHQPTVEALSRLHLDAALTAAGEGREEEARRRAQLAERVARAATEARLGRASAWGWLGTVCATRAQLEDDPAAQELALARAVEAWREGERLRPHGLMPMVSQFEALRRLGREAEAAEVARRAISLDARLGLDPAMQLSEEQRRRLERAARSP